MFMAIHANRKHLPALIAVFAIALLVGAGVLVL